MRSKVYASGQEPKRGDTVAAERYFEPVGSVALSAEEKQTWVVTSVVGDMVRCKCLDADGWRQAHYVDSMRLISRKNV
jgi:hypothetical protein